jgi:hypothetical protein
MILIKIQLRAMGDDCECTWMWNELIALGYLVAICFRVWSTSGKKLQIF